MLFLPFRNALLYFFSRSQLCAVRPSVKLKFFLRREDGFSLKRFYLRLFSAHANRERRRTCATFFKSCKNLLYRSVLKRMERKHCDPSAGSKCLYRILYCRSDYRKLAVYFYSYCLKSLLCGMMSFKQGFFGRYRFYYIYKLKCGFYRFFFAPFSYGACYFRRIRLLAVFIKNSAKLAFRITVYNVIRLERSRAIHSHVERCVKVVRKASFGCVKLI